MKPCFREAEQTPFIIYPDIPLIPVGKGMEIYQYNEHLF